VTDQLRGFYLVLHLPKLNAMVCALSKTSRIFLPQIEPIIDADFTTLRCQAKPTA
jgi:hypothetical protein